MNKALIIIAIGTVSMMSCNMEPKDHTKQISRMEDTMFKSFPTVNRVSVEVKDDFGTEVNITLGDAELYNATEERRKEVTNKTAAIVKDVFAMDKPEKGKVIFVKEEKSLAVDEASNRTYEMNLKN